MHGKPLVYLDSAATALKPQIMIDVISDFYTNHYGTVHRAVYELSSSATDRYNLVRQKVCGFINATSASEIVYTKGTTDSINLVASSFPRKFMKEGDEIIISQLEHHANIIPWQVAVERFGYVLKVIPSDENGELVMEEYAKLLSPRTRMVALGHVANSWGTINPVKEMIKMAHSYGAKVLIDGAQAVPHLRVDVQDLDADFYAFSAHKLYGPTGIGILYGKKELLEGMPPYQTGGDMVDTVTFEKSSYNQPPLKFEAGTPMIAEVIGLGAAIDYIEDIGLDEIQEYDHNLLKYATERLLSTNIPGFRILGPSLERKSAIISFVVEGVHPLDIGTMLDFKGVAIRTGQHCAQPALRAMGVEVTARASLSFYNNKEDVDSFVSHLIDVVKKLR